MKETILFSMENTINLAKQVARISQHNIAEIEFTTYADGEMSIKSKETVRNKDVFVIACTSSPVNDNIMRLLIFVDSLKRASANSVNVILTYYGYARQDRKTVSRTPITAKLVANLLQTSGINKLITLDLHNPSIQGFFDVPVDDLRAQYVLAQALVEMKTKFTIVSPDHGGTVRARLVAELISKDIQIAIVDKRRIGVNKAEVLGIIGDVKGQNIVIVDDIIDTGGTIINAANALKKAGAKKIVVAATHGLFSRGFESFENSQVIDKVMITDSVDQSHLVKKYKKIEIVCLAPFIAKVLEATIAGKSINGIYSNFRDSLL